MVVFHLQGYKFSRTGFDEITKYMRIFNTSSVETALAALEANTYLKPHIISDVIVDFIF